MSEKDRELMKQFLAKKKEDQVQKQKYDFNKKIGSAQKAVKTTKTRGSNNKV